MNLAKLIRASGLILALGGLLLICAEIVYILYPGDPEVREITAASQISAGFFFSGALLLTVGLPGVYLRQAERAGGFGVVAFLVALAGSALMIASDWNELFAGPALMLIPNFEKDLPASLFAGYILNYATYTLGWLLFGIATLRARVLPRPLALLLSGGILLPFIGVFSLHIPGDFMPCYIAFTWLGLAAARAGSQDEAKPLRAAPAPLAEPDAA